MITIFEFLDGVYGVHQEGYPMAYLNNLDSTLLFASYLSQVTKLPVKNKFYQYDDISPFGIASL